MYLLLNLIISLILLFLCVLLVLIVLMAVFPFKLAAAFVSEQQPDMHLAVSWLNPVFKLILTRNESHTYLTIQLLNYKVYSKDLSKDTINFKKKAKHMNDYINMLRAFKVKGIKLYASYGFIDPSLTGMLFGIIDIVSQTIGFEEYYNNADFASDSTYFNITASAKVNAATSVYQLLSMKFSHSNNSVLNGTIKK